MLLCLVIFTIESNTLEDKQHGGMNTDGVGHSGTDCSWFIQLRTFSLDSRPSGIDIVLTSSASFSSRNSATSTVLSRASVSVTTSGGDCGGMAFLSPSMQGDSTASIYVLVTRNSPSRIGPYYPSIHLSDIVPI